MKFRFIYKAILTVPLMFLLLFSTNRELWAENGKSIIKNGTIRVFLDRFRRTDDHIKREIPFVNYVRDTKQAQVYILLTSQGTGGGGRESTLTFIGQEEFTGMNDTLTYVTKQFDTEEMTRQELVKILKMGLMRYVAKTPQADNITINYTPGIEVPLQEEVKDKWNYWVFNLSSDVRLSGEESYKTMSFDGALSANRVTDKWKIQLRYDNDYNESENVTEEETYTSVTKEHRFRGLIVKSITDHWSVGINTDAMSSTKINTYLSVSAAPAIEYNIFPYSQSTRKQVLVLYSLWAQNAQYNDETIHDKMSENLFSTSLRISAEILERWGSISSSLEGKVFFHDPEVNKLAWNGRLSFRISEGLSLDLNGNVSLIHDQLYIAKGERTVDEVLLKITELKTDWRYRTQIGLKYRFGSMFDNIVNPRFGGQYWH